MNLYHIYIIYYKTYFLLWFVSVSRINFLSNMLKSQHINKAENYKSFKCHKWNVLLYKKIILQLYRVLSCLCKLTSAWLSNYAVTPTQYYCRHSLFSWFLVGCSQSLRIFPLPCTHYRTLTFSCNSAFKLSWIGVSVIVTVFYAVLCTCVAG